LRAGQTSGWIFMRDSSKDVKSPKDVPFWSYKTCLRPKTPNSGDARE